MCVFTSEIKPYAVKILQENHPGETITGDITKVNTKNIPDFDILCAGFHAKLLARLVKGRALPIHEERCSLK